MFKITTKNETSGLITVNLCGRFTSEYISEVEKALAPSGIRLKRLTLDLAEVTLVDRSAIMFLCAARSRNISIQNVPVYVGLWMDQEDCKGSLSLDQAGTTDSH